MLIIRSKMFTKSNIKLKKPDIRFKNNNSKYIKEPEIIEPDSSYFEEDEN